jgi:hypothetical protein
LKASQEIRSETYTSIYFFKLVDGKAVPPLIEDHLMTPYGPPDKNVLI